MGHRPRVLVCEQDVALSEQLSRTLEGAGFWVDAVQSGRQALHRLATRQYQALTLNLLLGDQDALSFSRELRVLGMQLPILVTSSNRQTKSTARRADLSLENSSDRTSDCAHPEPEWVRKAVDQARFIFAVKSACQRSRDFHPRILHVEADRFSAGLVKAALRESVDLIQAGDALELDAAMDLPDYDLALLNPDMADIDGEAALHRIAALYPETPVVLHRSGKRPDSVSDLVMHETASLSLVTALRTLLLHAMRVPLRAQA
ncbi:MAG: response regulator [Thiohalobacteraceae bacterium]